MAAVEFDFDAVFDANYLFFYEPSLRPERSDQEADLIVRLLGLQPGMRVLDLACGHGRIANRLARWGIEVVGLDASSAFLDIARRDAQAMGVSVEYIRGDMRSLPWTDQFDAIVSWFTSFGYFSDEENRRVLAEVHRALRPGGRLLIETIHRDRLLRHLQPHSVVEREGQFLIDRTWYDVHTGRVETERTVVRDGQVRRMRFGVRLYTFPELRDWLTQAGFRTAEGFDERGEPYSLESRRMIVTARK